MQIISSSQPVWTCLVSTSIKEPNKHLISFIWSELIIIYCLYDHNSHKTNRLRATASQEKQGHTSLQHQACQPPVKKTVEVKEGDQKLWRGELDDELKGEEEMVFTSSSFHTGHMMFVYFWHLMTQEISVSGQLNWTISAKTPKNNVQQQLSNEGHCRIKT